MDIRERNTSTDDALHQHHLALARLAGAVEGIMRGRGRRGNSDAQLLDDIAAVLAEHQADEPSRTGAAA